MTQMIGSITVGQSPRDDIVPAMRETMGHGVRVLERGALDGLSLEEIRSLSHQEGMSPLCTRLVDGTEVVVAKERIIARIQAKVDELNRAGVALIILLCTGQFPGFRSNCLVLEAQRIVDRSVEAVICEHNTLGLVVPLAEQVEQIKRNLSHITSKIIGVSASPYESPDALSKAAAFLREKDVDLVVMHCMGFTNGHRRVLREVTGKPVILANSIVARTIGELLQS
jgi:protein AroM